MLVAGAKRLAIGQPIGVREKGGEQNRDVDSGFVKRIQGIAGRLVTGAVQVCIDKHIIWPRRATGGTERMPRREPGVSTNVPRSNRIAADRPRATPCGVNIPGESRLSGRPACWRSTIVI